MPLLKNPGPPLVSKFRGIIELIPPEWRAKLGIKQTDQQDPVDINPTPLTGTLIESKVVQERTDERKKTNVEIDGDVNQTLIEQERLPNGQIATRTRRFLPEGTSLVISDTSINGEQKNLGIGWLDQGVLDADLPGPTIFSTRLDKDGIWVTIAKTRKLISAITLGESVVGSDWIRVTKEGETSQVATEVVETRPIG